MSGGKKNATLQKQRGQQIERHADGQIGQQNADPQLIAEQKRKERELRTQRIVESCRVKRPEHTILKGSFAKEYKNSIGANKRKRKAHLWGSELRGKRLNAETADAAEASWAETVLKRKQAAGVQVPVENDAITQFLTKNKTSNRYLLNNIDGGSRFEAEVGSACIRQFMELNFKLDLRNDETFAKESVRMEEIYRKTEALKLLRSKYPDFDRNLTEDEKIDLEEKLKIADAISNYYRIQKMVITNPYYKTHYRSEISSVFRPEDTLEQRNLSLLINQAEFLRSQKEISGDARLQNRYFVYHAPIKREDIPKERELKLRMRNIPSVVEYGKNDPHIERSPHANYFRLIDHEDSTEYKRLKGENYRVTGMDVEMKESFVRYLSNLPRWKVIQHMTRQNVVAMIEDLSSTPVNREDPQETELCRQRNLTGLRSFKDALKRQVDYLKRKYGNGFLLLTPEELEAHHHEFENDFTNMQGLSEFVTYIKKIPGMFDPSDPTDVDMDQYLSYFQNCALAEGMTRNVYLHDSSRNLLYADYKAQSAAVTVSGKLTDCQLNCEETLHLDVRWDTIFDEQNVFMDEVLTRLRMADPNTNINKNEYTQEELNNFKWNLLFPETRNLPSVQAADLLIKKDAEPFIESHRAEWRHEGIVMGRVLIPGIGSDDFSSLLPIYRKAHDNPELREQYGITSPEILEELGGYIKAFEEAGEYLELNNTLIDRAVFYKNMTEREAFRSHGFHSTMMHQISKALDQCATNYEKINHDYMGKNGDGGKMYHQFMKFRERIGMWHYPEHKEIMKNHVEPEIERQEPDSTILISGTEYQVYEGIRTNNILDVLKDRNLKEGVTQEQFAEAVKDYNTAYARFRVLDRIKRVGDYDTDREEEPLWAPVKHKKAFFQYDIYNRLDTCYDQWTEALKRMEDMTEKMA